MVKPLLILLAIAFLWSLAGCSALNRGSQAEGSQNTPTQSIFFASGSTPSTLAANNGGPVGTPTLSVMFAGQIFTAHTAQLSPAARVTPTLSGFFFANGATASPTLANPGSGTPTLSILFHKGDATQTPTLNPDNPTQATPSATPKPTNQITPTTVGSGIIAQSAIFSDTLNADWILDNSWGGKWSLDSAVNTPEGHKSVSYKPSEDFGALFFSVQKSTSHAIPRKQTMGISFRLNPGDLPLGADQLAVTVVGSNDYTYWLKGDSSVTSLNNGQIFSETRLYYLNVNRALPPNTWTEITVWLDKLQYDPMYDNVTGIYLKTDRGVQNTIYVADVTLLSSQ